MHIYGLMALACASGFIVLFIPNIIALGGVTVIGSVTIIAFCLRGSHTVFETLTAIALFLTVFQATFLVSSVISNLMFGMRTQRHAAKKPGSNPFA